MTVSNSAALEKRLKRSIYAQPQQLRIVPAPGWKDTCAAELQGILNSLTQSGKFAAEWMDDPEGLALRNLDFRQMIEIPCRLLTAQACMWKILDRHVGSFGELVDALRALELELYLPAQAALELKVQSFQSHLYHEGKLHEIISNEWSSQGFLVKDQAPLHMLAEQRGNRFCLYLSLGPYPLHHRHYKAEARHGAPLQECLAASAIRWFMHLPDQKDWQPDQIVVPFAGSGTLLFETWLYFGQIPADLWRPQDFLELLPATPLATLQSIRKRLRERMEPSLSPGLLIEKDPEIAQHIMAHIESFTKPLSEVKTDAISICGDFFSFDWLHAPRIFAPLNPPYGLRLSQEGKNSPAEFYSQLGSQLKKSPKPGCELRGFILTPDEESLQALRRQLGAAAILAVQSFSQGGQHIRCVAYRVRG